MIYVFRHNSNTSICKSVVESLGEIGGDRAEEFLIQLINRDDNDDLFEYSIKALVKNGRLGTISDRAINVLFVAMNSDRADSNLIQFIVKTLLHVDEKIVIEALVDTLMYEINKTKSKWHKTFCLDSLAKIGGDRVEDFLIQLTNEGDKEAYDVLSMIGGNKSLGVMINTIYNPQSQEDSIFRAIERLSKLGGKKATDALIYSLENISSAYDHAKYLSAIALGEVGGNKAVLALIRSLQVNNGDLRKISVKALGVIGGKKAIDAIIYSLHNDRSKAVRKESAKSLSVIGGRKAIKALKHTRENDSTISKYVSKLLAKS